MDTRKDWQTWQPYPLEALPAGVRRFTKTCAKAIGCDPAYIALPLLTTCAACIGNSRVVQIKRGWTEPAVIWSAIIGESGAKKSPALKLVLKALREKQIHGIHEQREAAKRHAAEWAEAQGKLAASQRTLARRGVEALELPPAARYIVSDTTVEALAPLLDANPRGLLLARDELAGWFGSMDRYAGTRGGDAAQWLSMFGAEQMIVDRKHQATIIVPRAAVSITGGIQPAVLSRALGRANRENGMAARLLLTMPPQRVVRWTDEDIPPNVEAEQAILIENLLELHGTQNAETGEEDPVSIPLSPEAREMFISFFNGHAEEQASLTGDLAAAWSKLEGYAARLALVLHLLRWASNEDPGLAIEGETMSSALTLLKWHKYETRRLYAALGETDDQRDQRQLLELIATKGGAITPRELMRSSRKFRTSGKAEQALDDLVKSGHGNWKNQAQHGRGRPTKRFVTGDDGVDADENLMGDK